MVVLMMELSCASVSWCALEFLGTIASVVSGVADAEYDEDGEVLQMKVLSAAEDDDVYTVCCWWWNDPMHGLACATETLTMLEIRQRNRLVDYYFVVNYLC